MSCVPPTTYVYDDVTYVYDDVTYVYDDVTYLISNVLRATNDRVQLLLGKVGLHQRVMLRLQCRVLCRCHLWYISTHIRAHISTHISTHIRAHISTHIRAHTGVRISKRIRTAAPSMYIYPLPPSPVFWDMYQDTYRHTCKDTYQGTYEHTCI